VGVSEIVGVKLMVGVIVMVGVGVRVGLGGKKLYEIGSPKRPIKNATPTNPTANIIARQPAPI
jgi:hypothetical protein